MGFFLGFGLKLLGFGKLVLDLLIQVIKGIFKFAIEKPFQFLTIALSLFLLWAGWWGLSTKHELVETKKVVQQKTQVITEQGKTIKLYVKALDVEKDNHVRDIKRGNDALGSVKKMADKALADAQAKAREVAAKKVAYDSLAGKYATANSSAGTAEDRIRREESTTDQFIQDIKEAKK